MLNVYCTYFILKHFKPTCWNGINSYCWPVSRKLPWASLDTTKKAHIVRNTCSLKRQKWIDYFKELTNPIHKNWNTVEDIYAHKYLCTHAGRAQPSWPGGIGTESSSHTLYLTYNLQTHGRLSILHRQKPPTLVIKQMWKVTATVQQGCVSSDFR